jgi:outer membrane protein
MRLASPLAALAAMSLVPQLAAAQQPAAPPPAATAAATPASPTVKLTLVEALSRAATASPDLAIARKSIDAAQSQLDASRALRLPSLNLEANAQLWDQKLAFAVAPGAPEVVVREQLTTLTSLSLVQPLSGLLVVGHMIDLDRAGLAAAKFDQQAARDQITSAVAHAYLGVLLARAQGDIAASRVAQIDAQLARARALAEGGVLQQVDVLRLEAALAGARRDVILANAGADSAADSLALLLGLPPGSQVEVVDDLPAEPHALPSLADASMSGRGDLAAAEARAEQAREGAHVSRAPLYPTVNAVANYSHNTGNGAFQPQDAWFVGLTLSWNLWDWGHNRDTYHAARHQAEQASAAAVRQAERARVELRKIDRDARATFDSLAVARAGQAAAEEAYRIQEARFAEGDATTTDLLSAEAELAQARVAASVARASYFAELASLAQATGQRPDTLFSQVR